MFSSIDSGNGYGGAMWAASAASTSGLAAASERIECNCRSRCTFPVSVKYFCIMPRSRHADTVVGKSVEASSAPSNQPLTASESFSSGLSGPFWFCTNAAMRGSISGFSPDPISSSAVARAARSARCVNLRQQGHTRLVDGLPLCLERFIFLLHLADGLQDFARHVFRGEVLEDFLHQGVLPAFPPQPQLIEHLLGVHEPQLFQRGLKVLGDLRVGFEILDDLLQGRHRHAVALALEIETHDLLAVLKVRGSDLVHEDLVEHLVGERARGDPHVPRLTCKASTLAYCGVSSVMTCTTFSMPPAVRMG